MKNLLPLTLALALTACAAPTPNAPPAVGTEGPAGQPTSSEAGAGGTLAPNAPVVQGRMLTGSAMLGDTPMANAAVSVYEGDGTVAIATATADAAGKFEIPLEKLAGQELVKLVAVSGDQKLVTLYAVPEADKAAYGLFQAGSLQAFQAQLSYSTTLSYLSLRSLLAVAAKATLPAAQAARIAQSFNTIAAAMDQGLRAQNTVAQMAPLLKGLSPAGEGTLTTALGQALVAQNTALTTALRTALSDVKGILIRHLPANDPAVLIAQNATVSIGNQTISGNPAGSGGSSSGGGAASAGLTADKPTMAVGDIVHMTGANFGTDLDLITFQSTAVRVGGGTNPFWVERFSPNGLMVGTYSDIVPGTYPLTILVNGVAVGTVQLTFVAQQAPIVTGLSATTVAEGSYVTLTGNNLGGFDDVRIGGRSANFVSSRPTSLVVEVPYGIVGTEVSVTVRGGVGTTVTAPGTLTVTQGPPQLQTIRPSTVLVGGTLSLYGAGYSADGGDVVTFTGGATATTTADAPSVVTVPAGAATGPVRLTVDGQLATAGVYLHNLVTVVTSHIIAQTVPAPNLRALAGAGNNVWTVAHTYAYNPDTYGNEPVTTLHNLTAETPDVTFGSHLDRTATAPNGDLWITGRDGTVVHVATPTATPGVSKLAASVYGDRFGIGVAVDSQNKPYVAEGFYEQARWVGRLKTFTVDGQGGLVATEMMPPQNDRLFMGVAVDGADNIWVLSRTTNVSPETTQLLKINDDATPGTYAIVDTKELGLSDNSGAGAVVSRDGMVWALHGTPTGTRITTFTDGVQTGDKVLTNGGHGNSMTPDGAGNLYYVGNGGIRRLAADGATTLVPVTGSGPLWMIPGGFWVGFNDGLTPRVMRVQATN